MHHVHNALYNGTPALSLTHAFFHLQCALGGREIQLLFAFIHAVWRCRCAVVNGHVFANFDDLVAHFRSIINDPWLHGSPTILDRSERRASRAIPPALPDDTYIYYFDGASRRGDDRRSASFGALLRRNDLVIARVAVFLDDMSNSEVEYNGMLAVLQHAVSMRYTKIRVYGDSKLVISQLNGVWRCKAENLTRYYERGLAMMLVLTGLCDDEHFVVSHVYREFNADADSLANIALDRFSGSNTVVINDLWYDRNNPRIMY